MNITLLALLAILVMFPGMLLRPAGYSMASGKARTWFHASRFALIMALVIYVILDFAFPRMGLIRLNAFDQVLVRVRESMNP